jgi:polyisoprenoid-binding protein YceI
MKQGCFAGAILLAMALLNQLPTCAQQAATTATAAAKKAQPGDVELQSSRVYAYVGKVGFGHEHAIEGTLKSGFIQLGVAEKAGKLEFDLRSFQADTQQARNYIGLAGSTDAGTARKVNTNMLGPEVLDVARFPTATFELKSARKHQSQQPPAAGQEYLCEGEFTLHGVKKPLKFIAVAEVAEGWIHLRGSFPIRQTDFGIRPFTTALGAIGVANDLTIYGDLWIVPDKTASKDSAAK